MGFFSKLFSKSTDDSQSTPSDAAKQLDLAHVYPRLKYGIPDDGTPATFTLADGSEFTLPHESMMVVQPFVEGLVLTYAIDEGTHFSFVANGHLSDSLTIQMVHEAAINNLEKETCDSTEVHGDWAELVMITNGGNYEATMVLSDSFMDYVHQQMNGDFYVAIPSRDLLYLAPKSNANAIERLQDVVNHHFNDEEFANHNHTYTRNIYERKAADKSLTIVSVAE